MTNLEAILEAIDALPKNDLNTVRQHIDQLTSNPDLHRQDTDVEKWIGNLHMAIEEFREGLSETELRDIVNSMNIGYISPKELHDLQQFMDWAEDGA